MKKFELEDENPVLERLTRQFQRFVAVLSTQEITSNEKLVDAIEALERTFKQSGVDLPK